MSFSTVTVIRPYEQIVGQIQEAIRDGALGEGDRLPTERELAETFGVSRSVVREAIKVLTAQGLVESRQGSGLYVRNRPIESITRAIVLSVSPDADSVERLFEFRRLLERDAARLAAERATDQQIEALDRALASFDERGARPDWEVFGQVDDALHDVIAEAAGNPYLQLMVASVRALMRDVVVLVAENPGSIDEAMRHHRSIRDAIAGRDAERAAAEMDRHIAYTASVVQSQAAREREGSAGR